MSRLIGGPRDGAIVDLTPVPTVQRLEFLIDEGGGPDVPMRRHIYERQDDDDFAYKGTA